MEIRPWKWSRKGAAPDETRAADADALIWRDLGGRGGAKSGVSVTAGTALEVSAVFSAMRVLSEGVAQLPLKLYREDDKGRKTLAKEHPLYRILWRRPNDWQTSFEFREGMTAHAVICGEAHAFINRVGGLVYELLPLIPCRCLARQLPDQTLVFDLLLPDGSYRTVPRSDILTIRGPSWDAVRGLEIFKVAREAIGLAIATEETHARLHSNGARPGGILSAKGLSKEARDALKAAWNEAYAGTQNAMRTAVLPGEVTWHQMSMSGVDAEHIATRKFQIEEICRILRVFPQMVGHSDKTSTFASAEAFFLAHVIHSLQPWVERWEQAICRDLLTEAELADLLPKFSLQGLLRGDAKSRAEYYASGIINGWLTRNEARRLEDLDPIDGLDEPLVPLNMGTQDERAALEKSSLDGLEAKAGRVLSAANEGRIVAARDSLSEVLASHGKDPNA